MQARSRLWGLLSPRDLTIRIPTLNAQLQDFDLLFSICNEALAAISGPLQMARVVFDFTGCGFLQQNAVAVIGGLTRILQKSGMMVSFRWDTLWPQVRKNLDRNGFLTAFGVPAQEGRGNAIQFREHGFPDKQEVLPYLCSEWLDRGWISLHSDVKAGLLGNIWELYANAAEHAESAVGVFTCGQYYPNMAKVRLAIVDFGIGIPENVRRFAKNPHLAADRALEWAFKPMTSTKEGGRGLGLSTIKGLVRANGGVLQVFSNEGYGIINVQGERYSTREVNFGGTIVNIELRYDEDRVYCYA